MIILAPLLHYAWAQPLDLLYTNSEGDVRLKTAEASVEVLAELPQESGVTSLLRREPTKKPPTAIPLSFCKDTIGRDAEDLHIFHLRFNVEFLERSGSL